MSKENPYKSKPKDFDKSKMPHDQRPNKDQKEQKNPFGQKPPMDRDRDKKGF